MVREPQFMSDPGEPFGQRKCRYWIAQNIKIQTQAPAFDPGMTRKGNLGIEYGA